MRYRTSESICPLYFHTVNIRTVCDIRIIVDVAHQEISFQGLPIDTPETLSMRAPPYFYDPSDAHALFTLPSQQSLMKQK